MRDLAARYGIPCTIRRADVAALAASTGDNVENAGREFRYAEAARLANELSDQLGTPRSAARILTAHTADDRAETFFMNAIRGAGAAGLSSIPRRRNRIVRPLLDRTHDELCDLLRMRGIVWREDATNADTRYLRAYVRHEVMPVVRARNPRVSESLASTCDILSDEDAYLTSVASRALRDLTRREGDGLLVLDAARLAAIEVAIARRVVRAALGAVCPGARLEARHIAGVLRAVTRGLDQPHPSVLVSRPTRLLRGFVQASGARRTSDKNQQQLARIAGVCALVSLLFTLLYRRDAGLAFTALAAVLCIGAPLAGTLLSAVPARLMQRSAAQVGAVVPGWRDIRQLGRINVIQVSARDLFPSGCVRLCGIRPVQKDHIDQAITYAASMLAQSAPTLREVFLGMIGDNRKLLSQVDDFETIYGEGHVGWINGERVLAGNRKLMQRFGIQLPSLDYEKRHTVNQRRVIYLAVSGKLFSMFLVAYQGDPDTAVVLDGLRSSGLSLIVDGDDFNCDETLLEAAYALPTGSVRVLDAAARKALEPATAWLPESEGNMLHLGSFASFVGGLEAAAGAATAERKGSMVLTASVLLSCLLAVIMVLAGSIAALPLPALVLYQAVWAALALVFPLLQRY